MVKTVGLFQMYVLTVELVVRSLSSCSMLSGTSLRHLTLLDETLRGVTGARMELALPDTVLANVVSTSIVQIYTLQRVSTSSITGRFLKGPLTLCLR